MSADLTCPTCDGAGESPLWHEEGPTATLWPCPHCADGRRRPYLAEWDALEAERDRAKEAVRNLDKALRNAVKERGDALDERDWLRAEIEKPADVLNAHDAVTEGDAALWDTSPGDALARSVSGLLDDLLGCQRDMHALARRFNDLEAERDHWWSETRREYDLAIETCNEVLENAGDEWDEDASIDYIAVKYVRWLEAERDRLQAELDAAHDARIEAQNPGIDIEDVRRHRREARARAALDSDPDLAERTRRIRADE